MKLCNRALNAYQIMNEEGEVRICGWQKDGGVIGRLTQRSMEELFNSKEARRIREFHLKNDYSNCDPDSCPFVANNSIEYTEFNESQKYPECLFLAYENVCNYHCKMCTIHECSKRFEMPSVEKKLNKIDDEVRKVMPYIKQISAHGLGELFVSRHILQILSEWKPLSDPNECSVILESNGSLFNEENWNKISNLGQYELTVTITVLSFNEENYRYLSGTELPINNLISNLHFIKTLREKNIVNKFKIATVYQDRNFRELPEFAKRCIEEFDADYVRLRPFEPWREDTMSEWFKDVRNRHHPYHEEFLEIMKDPIFDHPRVHDWGGGRESMLGSEPYLPMRHRSKIMESVMNEGFPEIIRKKLGDRINVYGMGVLGKAIVRALGGREMIDHCIDRKNHGYSYADVPVLSLETSENADKAIPVLISNIYAEDMIEQSLRDEGYCSNIMTISELTGIKRSDFM